MSYGQCEAVNGAAGNAAYYNAYQSAAAAGVSVFVSSGDESATSCSADASSSTTGIGVSGWTSTPYNVSVGGTDFEDTYNASKGSPAIPVSTYWSSTNTPTDGSAKSYIPEIPWNDSCAGFLVYNYRGRQRALRLHRLLQFRGHWRPHHRLRQRRSQRLRDRRAIHIRHCQRNLRGMAQAFLAGGHLR
jgi:hypothetical protein